MTAEARRLFIDAGAAAGLVLALALVFVLDKGCSSLGGSGLLVEEDGEEEVVGGAEPAPPRRPPRLAVTEPEYDDMGRLLATLGAGYRYETIPLDDLLTAGRLSEYDAVFLTCSGVPESWLSSRMRPGLRRGSGVFRARPEIVDAIKPNLRRFVGRGGTLYVSDWHFDLLALAFPELVDQAAVARGQKQSLEAEVVDAGLRRRLGPTIELRFEMPYWRPAAFAGPEVTTYLQGTYKRTDGAEATAPLLVAFPFQEGVVVFTSFHNEAQNTETELELLRHLVFTTLTAREEARIKRTMIRGGVSPKERSLLSVSSGGEPVTETYTCGDAEALQFVLGFEDQGARLQLTVTGPDGRKHEKTGTKTFTIDVPHPAAGQWRYTVAPLEVPYRNFPFTLTIGEQR